MMIMFMFQNKLNFRFDGGFPSGREELWERDKSRKTEKSSICSISVYILLPQEFGEYFPICLLQLDHGKLPCKTCTGKYKAVNDRVTPKRRPRRLQTADCRPCRPCRLCRLSTFFLTLGSLFSVQQFQNT